MIATLTSRNDCASAMVSSRRQRYNSVTASTGKLRAKRVFTVPARGALAIMTNVRSPLRDCGLAWLDSIRC